MFIDNPTAPMVANIKQMQQATLAKLNALTEWSHEDFDQVFLCYHDWYPHCNDWAITCEHVALLMADPRTPAAKLERIKNAIRRKTGDILLAGRLN